MNAMNWNAIANAHLDFVPDALPCPFAMGQTGRPSTSGVGSNTRGERYLSIMDKIASYNVRTFEPRQMELRRFRRKSSIYNGLERAKNPSR
jgi:hypothetical protein